MEENNLGPNSNFIPKIFAGADTKNKKTPKEILDKDTQLSVSMFCKTEKELTLELNQLGNVSKIWQSYNFMGFCVKL